MGMIVIMIAIEELGRGVRRKADGSLKEPWLAVRPSWPREWNDGSGVAEKDEVKSSTHVAASSRRVYRMAWEDGDASITYPCIYPSLTSSLRLSFLYISNQ